MNLLQHFARNLAPQRAAHHLSDLTACSNVSIQTLRDAIEVADQQHQQGSDHFGLCFALGRACERVASGRPWDERGPWVERALGYYEHAVRLALAGDIAGSRDIAEVGEAAWESGLGERERAVLAASFQAGLIRSAEFRTRDPLAGINHLTRVVNALRGYHPAWYFLGEAYLLDHQFDRAERVWTEALARAPTEPTLLAVLRNLPIDRVHHAAKIKDWRAVLREIERLPGGAMPESERLTIEGDAHRALGDDEAARRCWLRALEADHVAVGVRQRLRKLDRSET